MKGEAQTTDKPIAKPPYPLPAIFVPRPRNSYSTHIEWEELKRDRQPKNRMTTARSKQNQ
ncbi:MAG TPA: hypothetical protein VFZ23_09340 [Pyrinomonadaceae bacterium]